MIWLIALIAVAALLGLIWNFKRQAAAREAASAERMKAFLEAARANPAARPSTAAAPGATTGSPNATAARSAETTTARSAQAQVAAAAVSGFVARAPLLDAAHTARYAQLQAALPDYGVFPQLRLAAFVQPDGSLTGFAREAQERRLADAVADFVVCDRAMNPVAVVQYGTRSGKAAEVAAFAAACVSSTGVRWVEIAEDASLDAQSLRQQVLGT